MHATSNSSHAIPLEAPPTWRKSPSASCREGSAGLQRAAARSVLRLSWRVSITAPSLPRGLMGGMPCASCPSVLPCVSCFHPATGRCFLSFVAYSTWKREQRRGGGLRCNLGVFRYVWCVGRAMVPRAVETGTGHALVSAWLIHREYLHRRVAGTPFLQMTGSA